MTMILEDPTTEAAIKARRAELGIDRFDEVWDGVYVGSPAPGSSHQLLLFQLHKVFDALIDEAGKGRTVQTVNISDRRDDWTENYRIPDLSVFLNANPAQNLDSHWVGGPDLAIEVLSPRDRATQKLDFYAKVGVRELLIVDRDPWSLELFQLEDGVMRPVGRVQYGAAETLTSQVIPLSFGLISGEDRPMIEAVHADSRQRWSI